MKNAEGRVINLNTLCHVKSTETTSKIVAQSTLQISKERLGGLAYIYAEQYCDWRQVNRTREESKKSAIDKLSNMIIQIYGADGAEQVIQNLDSNFFDTTDRLIQHICPKKK
ncbi:MAG: hypothetical protein DSM106950_34055 [Stigonema ocellatum SAG 48.90 = DSM 106950]|nr:hypothetical protein [Stigonema ocellatum SAG 48.90 = DSM 106950]